MLKRNIYIDKSDLISYTNGVMNSSRMLTCFSRPRRFGKSYAAKMLAAYYSKGADTDKLFQPLKIAKDTSYKKYLNSQDVLFLDFAWFISISSSLENTVSEMQENVLDELRNTFPNTIGASVKSLRSVVIMAYLSCMDHYPRFEELASGKGYSDILFLPNVKSSKPALLIELKWNKSEGSAVTQMKEKNYSQLLKQFDYQGEFLLVGINYSTKTKKHTCKIEKEYC